MFRSTLFRHGAIQMHLQHARERTVAGGLHPGADIRAHSDSARPFAGVFDPENNNQNQISQRIPILILKIFWHIQAQSSFLEILFLWGWGERGSRQKFSVK